MTNRKYRRPGDDSTRAAKPLSKKHLKVKGATSVTADGTSWALNHAKVPDAPEVVKANQPLDWYTLLSSPPGPPDWLLKPFIARGKLVSLYSKAKAGKSLVVLDVLFRALSGTHIDGSPAAPVTVLYLDQENDDTDLHERLDSMGAQPHDLERLVYIQFPEIEPLTSKSGGRRLLQLVEHYGADLVVLDTVSRFVDGSENDSSTWFGLYSHTLAPLKKRGVATLRLDHSGRDESKGARGSSAKDSDIDAIWSLEDDRQRDVRVLVRRMARNSAGPDRLELRVDHEPLRHRLVDPTADRVQHLVQELDRLNVDGSVGREAARKELEIHGIPASNKPLAEAVKIRKSRTAGAVHD